MSVPAMPPAWASKAPEGIDAHLEYVYQKYEALQKQLISTQQRCSEQLQRQEALERELQDPLVAEQGRHELRAEQRCAQLAEECKQRSLQSDEVVQQLAQQDREVARQKFEAVSVSRRLRQTQADADVVNEDLRIEAQRQLLAQNGLLELQNSLQVSRQQLWLAEQEAERSRVVVVERKAELREADEQIQDLAQMVKVLHQEKQRSLQGIAIAEDECAKLEHQLHLAKQDLGGAREQNLRRATDLKAQTAANEALRGNLNSIETQRASLAAEMNACGRCIAEAEGRISECKALSVQAFREKEDVMQKVYDLKQEQQELDGLCLAQRRAGHAEVLAVEDLRAELEAGFLRKDALMTDLERTSKACGDMEKQLEQLRPSITEAEQLSSSLEVSLAQKSKDLEDELHKERCLQQDLAASQAFTKVLSSPQLAPRLTDPGTMPARRLR